tara:strand:+ start:3107 stop:3352 length:246 start_codon:yes stop_codon:yes gene_type:complete
MLEKVQVIDRIEVIENGSVQVRTCTRIMEDGKQISGTFHRHVVVPGNDYANEDARVKAICAATHTAQVIAAYEASLVARPE